MFYINVRICSILFSHLIYNFTEVFTRYAQIEEYCVVSGFRSGYKSTRQTTSSVGLPDVSKARSHPVKRSIFQFSRNIQERKWAAAVGCDVECLYGVNWGICEDTFVLMIFAWVPAAVAKTGAVVY